MDVINLVSSDEETTHPRKRPRAPPTEDDVQIISHVVRRTTNQSKANRKKSTTVASQTPSPLPATTTAAPTAPPAEGVECVGERRGIQALADYPHFRFQCALEQFKRQRAAKKERFCSRCFCYVCDVPASQCPTWVPHAKAVDTVPKWRAEREARLEERRRREQCQTPALRASVVSRVMAPMRAGAGSDSSSFDGGDSSDGLEVRDSVEDGEITEGRLERCDFERTVARMGGVALEMDCFRMAELTRELTLPTQTGSRRRAREFDVAALL